MSDNLEMYCVTNRKLNFLENLPYKLCAVGQDIFSEKYIKCNNSDNIFYKEKNYSELTFHYWYWKNLLNINKNNWVGFCQKRRFWIKTNSKPEDVNKTNLKEHLILKPEEDWDKYESMICSPVKVFGAKKIKILKRGWRSIIKNPSLLLGKKRETIMIHFDMHHGYGNLEKAIAVLDLNERSDFSNYVNTNSFFNPHIMCISKPHILNKWFNSLFPWLERCEEVFGLNLEGYDLQRMYAFIAERYLSYWFKKYTKYKELNWVFVDN